MSGRSNVCQLCGAPGEIGTYDIRPVTIIYRYGNDNPGRQGMLVCHKCRRGDLVGSYHYKDAPIPKQKIHKRKYVRHYKQPAKITNIIKSSSVIKENKDKFVALVKTEDGLISLFYFDGKELSRDDGAGKCTRLSNFNTLSNSIKEILREYPDGDFRVFNWTEGDKIFLDAIVPMMMNGIMRLPKAVSKRPAERPVARTASDLITPKEVEEKNREFTKCFVPKNFTVKSDEGKILYYCCSRVTPSGGETVRQGLKARGFPVKICFDGTKDNRVYCVYSSSDIAKKIRDFGTLTAFAMLRK